MSRPNETNQNLNPLFTAANSEQKLTEMSNNNGIADIYRSVISDVISNMKEAFLDETIDIDVLSQLKKEWEDKVNASGCVDLDSNAGPPAPRQHIPQQAPVRPNPISQQQRMNIVQQPGRSSMAVLQAVQAGDAPLRMGYTAQPGQPPQPVRMFPQFANGIGSFPGQMMLVQHANGQGVPMMMNPNQLQQRIMHQNQQQQQQQQQQHHQLSHMNQMDGNGGSDGEGSSGTVALPNNTKSSLKVKQRKVRGTGASQKTAMKVLGSLLKEIQLDGGGGGMSDSSSEDEPEDEDDPLRRIVDRIGNGEVEDGDNIAEEDPLNSGDDQSDDEDLTMLFDADNVVMCQFEKVNRARTKWKFQLKDGIMHIDKKDYCFQKCSGEAEW